MTFVVDVYLMAGWTTHLDVTQLIREESLQSNGSRGDHEENHLPRQACRSHITTLWAWNSQAWTHHE